MMYLSCMILKGYVLVGIDVFYYQGVIDWEDLMIKYYFDIFIDFVYCKVIEGIDYLDL